MRLNVVPPRTGLSWVRLGLRTFLRKPLALAGLFFMATTLFLLASLIPLLGLALTSVLTPVATLAMMAAAREAHEGRFPNPSLLFAGLRGDRARVRSMLVLGAVYAAATLAIGLLTWIAFAPAGDTAAGATNDPAALLRSRPDLLIALALQFPLAFLFSHSPALVHWHGMPPVKALFFSAVAFKTNFGAFLVFTLAWAGVGLVWLLAIGLVLRLAGVGASTGLAIFPSLLLLAAVATSMYFTFRDSFSAETATASP